MPLALELARADAESLDAHAALLARAGIELEPGAATTLRGTVHARLRSLPALLAERARHALARAAAPRPRARSREPSQREARDGLERALHDLLRHRPRVTRRCARATGSTPREVEALLAALDDDALVPELSARPADPVDARSRRARAALPAPLMSGGAAARRRDRRADGHRQDRARLRGRAPRRAPRSSAPTRCRSTAASTSARPSRRRAARRDPAPRARPGRARRADVGGALGGGCARAPRSTIAARGRPILLVGGTGLYARAFAGGLIAGVGSDRRAARRARGAQSTADLRAELACARRRGRGAHPAARPRAHGARARGAAPGGAADLGAARAAPLRRSPVRASSGSGSRSTATRSPRGCARACDAMFAAGWSTRCAALHAAGYDARACGRCARSATARSARCSRASSTRPTRSSATWIATRRYAKRQRTWFRAEPGARVARRRRAANAAIERVLRGAQPSLIVLYETPTWTGQGP